MATTRTQALLALLLASTANSFQPPPSVVVSFRDAVLSSGRRHQPHVAASSTRLFVGPIGGTTGSMEDESSNSPPVTTTAAANMEQQLGQQQQQQPPPQATTPATTPDGAEPQQQQQQQAATEDIARDLFLENSPENLAMINSPAIFEQTSNDTTVTTSAASTVTEFMEPLEGSPLDENNAAAAAMDNVQEDSMQVDPSSVLPLTKENELEETVQSILEASEIAVAAAEASLSPEISDQLSPFDTTTTSGDSSGVENSQAGSTREAGPETEILPAAAVVGDSAVSGDTIQAPSLFKILKFAIPATGVWLCDPLLSLIDTSAVGVLSGTIQQAALNPAVAVVDYAALLIAFLYTGATNLIAAAKETDRGVEGLPRTTKNLVGSLQLSTWVGIASGALLFAFSNQLIRAIAGKGVADPAVFEAASRYVQIRSLGMPAAAIIGSAQAACLGLQDIKSQFIILSAAAVVNLMGDILFVGNSNAWIGGAAGAAWATVFSQYVSVALFAQWLCHKAKPRGEKKAKALNLSNAILEMTGKKKKKNAKNSDHDNSSSVQSMEKPRRAPARKVKSLFGIGRSQTKVESLQQQQAKVVAKPSKEEAFSVRGFLDGRVRKRDLWKFPSRDIMKAFRPFVLPVTSAQFGRISGYVAMSYVVCSLGTICMAAQQIIASMVYSLFPVADSLSLTGQSFVPAISEQSPSKERSRALRKTMLNLCKAAIVLGTAMVGFAFMIPMISSSFTSDPSVFQMVNSVVPLLAANFPFYALAMALEGFLLGQKDLGYQGKMYTSWCFIIPYFMLRVKSAVASGTRAAGLSAVWEVMLGYQVLRFGSWLVRALFLQRQHDREAARVGA
mmetsp:Transcript_26392/g.60648  ORF Transcript_26392/g.60648 Transcript_26392/m.60648 type:complete len:845 (-) Transcript_26392:191-2725(-)